MLCHEVDRPHEYAMKSIVHTSNINTLKSIYCVHFHSIIVYGIILEGYSSNCGKIFTLQQKIIRIMANAQLRPSKKESL